MPIRLLVVLFLLLAFLVPTPALAGDDDAAAMKKHIAVLMHEAGALKAEGRLDAAEVLWKRAHELKERLTKKTHQRDPVPLTMEQAEKVLHGLEMGMESLKVLRREKELKAVAKVANGIRERMQKARAKRSEHPEIKEARRQLEILRIAFHGLREGEKREAMERMEHAIHVMELNIEGRRDEEAQAIRRKGPGREERADLLRLAAKLWDGFGHESRARTIRELAEKMAPQRRQAAQPIEAEHIERLHHQIHELRQAMERLQEAVRRLEHRMEAD